MNSQRGEQNVLMIVNELQEYYKGNVFYNMFVMYSGVTKNEDLEDGSKQPSTKQQKGWKRQLCVLENCEGNWESIFITLIQCVIPMLRTKLKPSLDD